MTRLSQFEEAAVHVCDVSEESAILERVRAYGVLIDEDLP